LVEANRWLRRHPFDVRVAGARDRLRALHPVDAKRQGRSRREVAEPFGIKHLGSSRLLGRLRRASAERWGALTYDSDAIERAGAQRSKSS
jgi:hypothetical protein